MNDKFKEFMRENFAYIIIILVSTSYIAYGLITIQKSGKTISEIIITGGLALIVGFLISRLMGLQGTIRGEHSDLVVSTKLLHTKEVESLGDNINLLDRWCEDRAILKRERARKEILRSEGLDYENFFDGNGNSKEITFNFKQKGQKKERERQKYKLYKKALKVKITTLNTSLLTGGSYAENFDIDNLGKTKYQHEKKIILRDLISKVLISVLFGYCSFKLLEFDLANIIWSILQVAIFLVSGSLKYFSSYIYVTDELRIRTIKQIDILQEFKSDLKTINFKEIKNNAD